MAKELVSIVIATYNEAVNIRPLLKSCNTQTYQPLEVIVVDSERSTDHTAEIARKFTKSVYTYGLERNQQRNFSIAKATGTFLLVLDADMKLDPSVVHDCVEVFKSKSVSAVIIPEKSYGEGYWAKCKALERNCYLGDPTVEAPRFFLKKELLSLGGYDPAMISGEDWDLGRRFKTIGSISRVSSFIHHNEGRTTLLKTVKKKYYYSKNASPFLEANIKGPKSVLLFVFRPAFLRNWRTLISDPIHLSGMIFMKVLEFGSGALAIVSQPVFWRKMFRKS